MEKFVEKLLDRLKEHHNEVRDMYLKGQGNFALLDGKMRGIEDANAIIIHLAKEYKGGWIPCSERLPDKRDWYLAVFKEPDTDFVLIPRVADYLGNTTLLTTNEGWLIIDLEDEMHINAYYKNLVCIAWRELPQPYVKGE